MCEDNDLNYRVLECSALDDRINEAERLIRGWAQTNKFDKMKYDRGGL